MMKRLLFFFLTVLILCGCSAKAPEQPSPTPPDIGQLKVHFIDVNHGDSTLVECNGEYMLVDAGEVYAGGTVLLYLAQLGVKKLDVVVSTHPHTDHMSGFATVLPELEVGDVYRSYRAPKDEQYTNFIACLEEKHITSMIPKTGDSFTLGGATVTVIGPVRQYADNTNNDSLVLLIRFGATSFLLAADMEKEAEADLIARGTDLHADVLRIGHHGSETSTSKAFLEAVDPSYAVISVGRKNAHNLPDAAPLALLRGLEIPVYRTDRMGTVVATSDGQNITFSWEFDTCHIIDNTTGLLHCPDCPLLPADANRTYFDTKEAAMAESSVLCSRCLAPAA